MHPNLILTIMRKAIIIGASSGLGAQVARLLAADGWRLGIAARRTELLEKLGEETGGTAVTAQIDVTAEDAGERLLSLIDRLGGMDLFFYSSGIGRQNYLLEEDIEMRTVKTNCEGFCRMVGTAYRYFMEKGGGHIAVISSIAGTKGLGAAPSYSATKAFQNKYVEALAQLAWMRGVDVRFTDLRPGFVRTDLLGDDPYPMLMNAETVAREMVKAVYAGRQVWVIDWRWRVLTFFWRLIPGGVWRHLKIGFKR